MKLTRIKLITKEKELSIGEDLSVQSPSSCVRNAIRLFASLKIVALRPPSGLPVTELIDIIEDVAERFECSNLRRYFESSRADLIYNHICNAGMSEG